VIPTTQKTLSRKDLIEAVRDQDGGAHSDPDIKLQKSTEYVELVNSFPVVAELSICAPTAVRISSNWSSPTPESPSLQTFSSELAGRSDELSGRVATEWVLASTSPAPLPEHTGDASK
jgi:hypothetical protein